MLSRLVRSTLAILFVLLLAACQQCRGAPRKVLMHFNKRVTSPSTEPCDIPFKTSIRAIGRPPAPMG